MENILQLIQNLAAQHSWALWVLVALTSIGGLSVVASGVVALTPTKKDDEFLAAFEQGKLTGLLWKFFRNFSLVKQKDSSSKPL